MIPPLIVETALAKGIGLIAITDHNATANIEAVQAAAKGTELIVLPGMELQTIEEVHVLCLFDQMDQAQAFQKIVSAALPDMSNNIDFFGEQFVVDESGDFIRREERLLLTSANLTIRQAWEAVTNLGGLMIPAHINRKAYGLIQVLGLVPEDTPIEILEISVHIQPERAYEIYPQIGGYPLVQNGDAHFLEDLRGLNQFTFANPVVEEIRRAVLGRDGRNHMVLSQRSLDYSEG